MMANPKKEHQNPRTLTPDPLEIETGYFVPLRSMSGAALAAPCLPQLRFVPGTKSNGSGSLRLNRATINK